MSCSHKHTSTPTHHYCCKSTPFLYKHHSVRGQMKLEQKFSFLLDSRPGRPFPALASPPQRPRLPGGSGAHAGAGGHGLGPTASHRPGWAGCFSPGKRKMKRKGTRVVVVITLPRSSPPLTRGEAARALSGAGAASLRLRGSARPGASQAAMKGLIWCSREILSTNRLL